MPEVPSYRLRLFLSVDLVGSTAFKAHKSSQEYESGNIKPKWVSAFTSFYEEFPRLVKEEFDKGAPTLTLDERENYPRIWKTIGDELILSARAMNLDHLAHSVSSFIAALKAYSAIIKSKSGMGVKGNAWIAACPAPNIGFAINRWEDVEDSGLDTSEKIELVIDKQPNRFDFLGKAIDTGFRISKNSRADRCTISVQLAYALSMAKIENIFNFELGFDGRVELKGVNDGIPYPILFIHTETDVAKRSLLEREFVVLGGPRPSSQQLKEFLETFMEVASIEKPYIGLRAVALNPNEKPETFKSFELAFSKLLVQLGKQDAAFESAELDVIDAGADTLDAVKWDELLPIQENPPKP